MPKNDARNTTILYPLLTFAEAANRLGCEEAELWGMFHAGLIVAQNPWGRWRIDPSDLERIAAILRNDW